MVASTSTTGSRSVKAPLPASAEPLQAAALHAELRSLIASSRQRLAGAVNAELTRLYWAVGHRLHTAKTRTFWACASSKHSSWNWAGALQSAIHKE